MDLVKGEHLYETLTPSEFAKVSAYKMAHNESVQNSYEKIGK